MSVRRPLECGFSLRIRVDLRDAAKAKAADRGESLTAVIIRALEEYVKA